MAASTEATRPHDHLRPVSRVAARFGRLLLVAAVCLLGCAKDRDTVRIPVQGFVAGAEVNSTVDSYWAAYYLEDYLAETGADPDMDAEITATLDGYAGRLREREVMAALNCRYSTDFATLVLARDIANEPESAGLRKLYREELLIATQNAENGIEQPYIDASELTFVFVPGWLYESTPGVDSDFTRQRRFISERSWRAELLRTEENGTVERNACIVARAIEQYRESGSQIVLISMSKSAPEVAMALGIILPPEETTHVRLWVNINGVLQGTPQADEIMQWPARLLAAIVMKKRFGADLHAVPSLMTHVSRRRFAAVELPEHITVINYMSMPLSGDISERAERGYRTLKKYGPNDGLTLSTDAIVPGKPILLEFGFDHYFGVPDIEVRTMALVRSALRYGGLAGPSVGPDLLEHSPPATVEPVVHFQAARKLPTAAYY